MSDIIPMQPRRSREHTHLILQRRVRHAVDGAIQPRLALPEQRGAKDDCKVLHGHLVLRLVLDDSIGRRRGWVTIDTSQGPETKNERGRT